MNITLTAKNLSQASADRLARAYASYVGCSDHLATGTFRPLTTGAAVTLRDATPDDLRWAAQLVANLTTDGAVVTLQYR